MHLFKILVDFMGIKIPPFRDSHIHFVIDGKRVSDEGIILIGNNLLKKGIKAVYDMGYKSGEGLRAKDILSDLLIIKSAGYAIYKSGTYGVFLGKGISEKGEIKKTVKEIFLSGADFIKVVNSGIIHPKGYITPGGFSFDNLKMICDVTKELGLKVLCHVNGDKAIRDAIKAGASSIEHGYYISKETIHMLKEKNISWTPTVYALKVYSEFLKGEERLYLEKVIEEHLWSINYASSIGVNLKVGTDSGSKGVKHGDSFLEELRLFQKAGLSFEKIIDAACMGKDEVREEEYLEVDVDFISTGKVIVPFYKG